MRKSSKRIPVYQNERMLNAAGVINVLLILAGCSSIDTQEPAQNSLPQQLSYFADNETSAADIPSWWQSFDDPALNQQVALGLDNNFSLQAAWASLAQSQALWRQAGADQYPDLNLSLSKSRQWRESVTTDLWSAGLSTEYELDFWGSIAALDDQARMTALASEAALRVQANTVAGEISLNWYGLLMQQENLALLAQQKQRIDDALRVIRGRFQRGQAEISDVWQQQQLLESLNTETITATAGYAGYQQQLALWTGHAEGFALQQGIAPVSGTKLPHIGTAIGRVELQSVARRPDVEQAWFNVQASNAGLAAAIANRYPRFTLSASYSGEDQDLGKVLDNWVGNLAGALVLPIIDGGSRRALVAQNRAAVDQALANYQQTLLEAALEVQQALISERQSVDTLNSLEHQLALARKSESFQNNRYRKGVGDFLSLLNSQQDVLSLEQQVLSARWNQIQSRIQLFRAVSHGEFAKEPSA